MENESLVSPVIVSLALRCCTKKKESDGSQTAFLDGNQPDRLCKPIVDHISSRGGKVLTGKPIRSIELNDDSDGIKSLRLDGNERVVADYYVSAMPVDVLKRLIPAKWSQMPYFAQLDELEGIPVINLQVRPHLVCTLQPVSSLELRS